MLGKLGSSGLQLALGTVKEPLLDNKQKTIGQRKKAQAAQIFLMHAPHCAIGQLLKIPPHYSAPFLPHYFGIS